MKALLFISALSFQVMLFSQVSVKGTLKDSGSNELIPFANISLMQEGEIITGSTTNLKGEFAFKNIPEGTYNINFSFVGYQTKSKTLVVKDKDLTINEKLEQGIILKEIEIIGYTQPLFSRTECGLGYTTTREEIITCRLFCGSRVAQKAQKRMRDSTKQTEIKAHIQELNVFPNPSRAENLKLSYFNNNTTANHLIEIQVFDILGKIIHQEGRVLQNGRLDLKLDALIGESKGAYFVNVIDGNKRFTQRVIIQ